MGFTYSYRLFFPRDRLWPVMRSLARFACAPTADDRIAVHLPDGSTLTLPFSSSVDISGAQRSWAMRSAPLRFDDTVRRLQFNTSLFFEPDEAIDDYVRSLRDDLREQGEAHPDLYPLRDADGRFAIGYIYLTVLLDPGSDGEIPARSERCERSDRSDRIGFDFAAATTSMSLLFQRSTAIRRAFVRLLEEHAGVCGVFDDESGPGEGSPFWPAGTGG